MKIFISGFPARQLCIPLNTVNIKLLQIMLKFYFHADAYFVTSVCISFGAVKSKSDNKSSFS